MTLKSNNTKGAWKCFLLEENQILSLVFYNIASFLKSFLFFLLFHHFISLREASIIMHEDFMEAINVVAAKKKGSLDYYA